MGSRPTRATAVVTTVTTVTVTAPVTVAATIAAAVSRRQMALDERKRLLSVFGIIALMSLLAVSIAAVRIGSITVGLNLAS